MQATNIASHVDSFFPKDPEMNFHEALGRLYSQHSINFRSNFSSQYVRDAPGTSRWNVVMKFLTKISGMDVLPGLLCTIVFLNKFEKLFLFYFVLLRSYRVSPTSRNSEHFKHSVLFRKLRDV